MWTVPNHSLGRTAVSNPTSPNTFATKEKDIMTNTKTKPIPTLDTKTVAISESPPNITTTWERIDSDRALTYLGQVKKNRLVRQSKVNQYARAMASNGWRETRGDPISFDTEGVLLDGQHRMWAVTESNIPILFRVDRGLPPDDLYVIDVGRSRSLKQFLQIDGEHNAGVLSSAITLLMAYEETGVLDRKTLSITPSIQEAMRFFHDRAPNLRVSTKGAGPLQRLLKGGGRWAVLHYILNSIAPDDAGDFFQKVLTGEDMKASHPILMLRKRLLENTGLFHKLPEIEYCALVIKTWNAYRQGTTFRVLAWRGGGMNPERFPLPA
jgi:hypothetical protein